MKLTEHQIKLLREASKYSLMELKGKYLRLGGHGYSPVCIVRSARIKLQNAGLLSSGSVIKTTAEGFSALTNSVLIP